MVAGAKIISLLDVARGKLKQTEDRAAALAAAAERRRLQREQLVDEVYDSIFAGLDLPLDQMAAVSAAADERKGGAEAAA